MPATKSSIRPAKPPKARMTLAEAMAALEQAGSEQTRKTYRRHGAREPLFGVSFATLKSLLKKIGVDHELALALWDTGNYDARNLAMKIVDPARMMPAELDAWAGDGSTRMCGGYVAAIACEGGHGLECAQRWLQSPRVELRAAGWSAVGALAMNDQTLADAWLVERLGDLERTLNSADNAQRDPMNQALIAIGCRNAALRAAATATAQRIGKVHIDHGDTACKTPDAAAAIAKAWEHSTAKGYDSPAAHERSREPMRLRC
jgi:3-methyladenine DNA glycosylase AlkD